MLFNRYRDDPRAWTAILTLFLALPSEQVPVSLIYYMAHIPWHPDIASTGHQASEETRKFARGMIAKFGYDEIKKLLECIDEDGIGRGTVGQSVEALISVMDDREALLSRAAKDELLPLGVRENAVLIYAMHQPADADSLIDPLVKLGSRFARELREYIHDVGVVNPYA